jgi:hypothetical protein
LVCSLHRRVWWWQLRTSPWNKFNYGGWKIFCGTEKHGAI